MSELSSVARVILGALHAGPRSGYEIKRLVDRSTRFFWAASYGQIYPELHRLEREGLVEGASESQGGRRRRVYRLTSAGREALREWLRSPDAGYELRDHGLLKLFFADALSGDEALELVRALRAQRQHVLDRLREVERTVPRVRERSFPLLVLEYGIGFHEWMIGWCAEVEGRLAEGGAPRKTEEVSTG